MGRGTSSLGVYLLRKYFPITPLVLCDCLKSICRRHHRPPASPLNFHSSGGLEEEAAAAAARVSLRSPALTPFSPSVHLFSFFAFTTRLLPPPSPHPVSFHNFSRPQTTPHPHPSSLSSLPGFPAPKCTATLPPHPHLPRGSRGRLRSHGDLREADQQLGNFDECD